MQLFILHKDHKINASYYVNRHVCKIQTEIAQMLSTVCHEKSSNMPDFLYKSTHHKHPCVLWLKESKENFVYGVNLGLALHDEYNYRYKGNGKYQREKKIFNWAKNNVPCLENKGVTPFAQAMPEEYRCDDAVMAYRKYYIGEKNHLFKWKNRKIPEWITEQEINNVILCC